MERRLAQLETLVGGEEMTVVRILVKIRIANFVLVKGSFWGVFSGGGPFLYWRVRFMNQRVLFLNSEAFYK